MHLVVAVGEVLADGKGACEVAQTVAGAVIRDHQTIGHADRFLCDNGVSTHSIVTAQTCTNAAGATLLLGHVEVNIHR